MDDRSFDAFARSFARSSRRRLAKRLLGGTAAGLLGLVGADAAAATCRRPGDVCRENANCCSGSCGPKDRTGRRT